VAVSLLMWARGGGGGADDIRPLVVSGRCRSLRLFFETLVGGVFDVFPSN
jgi:hypothetical protein